MAAKNTTHYLQTFCKLNSFLDNRKASLTRYVKEEKFTDENSSMTMSAMASMAILGQETKQYCK